MTDLKIIGALIGLAGAISNNGKTEQTDAVVRGALKSQDADQAVRRIHDEKRVISPNCETCQFPCGNTSDYAPERFEQSAEPVIALKKQVILALMDLADRDPLP